MAKAKKKVANFVNADSFENSRKNMKAAVVVISVWYLQLRGSVISLWFTVAIAANSPETTVVTATRVVAAEELVKDSTVIGFLKLESQEVVATRRSTQPRFEAIITAGFITDRFADNITNDLVFIDVR